MPPLYQFLFNLYHGNQHNLTVCRWCDLVPLQSFGVRQHNARNDLKRTITLIHRMTQSYIEQEGQRLVIVPQHLTGLGVLISPVPLELEG